MLEYLNLILGGGALVTAAVTLIIFLIKRHDERSDKNDETLAELKDIKKQMKKMEKDSVRTQLLVLMQSYTYGDAGEILTVAEYYFVVLKGDWYMTSLFQQFCKKEQIPMPPWFNKKGE